MKLETKVSAFNGHIQISNFDSNNSEESIRPINLKELFVSISNNVKSVNQTALKFGIIRTSDNFMRLNLNEISNSYNWNNI